MKTKKPQSGFTLLEMLIVLVIISVIASLSLPNAAGYVDNNRMSAAVMDFAVAIQTARTEAVSRNMAVSICTSNDAADGCRSTAQWEKGWLLFVDADADGVVDSGEEVIQYHAALADQMSIRGTSEFDAPVTFFASGRTSIDTTQTLIFCDARGFSEDSKGLVVSILGRSSRVPAASTGADACDL